MRLIRPGKQKIRVMVHVPLSEAQCKQLLKLHLCNTFKIHSLHPSNTQIVLPSGHLFSFYTWNADCRSLGPSHQRTPALHITPDMAEVAQHLRSCLLLLCGALHFILKHLTKCNHYQNRSQLHLVKMAFLDSLILDVF